MRPYPIRPPTPNQPGPLRVQFDRCAQVKEEIGGRNEDVMRLLGEGGLLIVVLDVIETLECHTGGDFGVGRKTSFLGLFILIDVVVATFLAGLLLAMFDAVPNQRFFFWFVFAAAVSLSYDFYSLFIAGRMRGRGQLTIDKYRGRINGWIKKDFIFLSASGLIYFSIAQNVIQNAIGFSSIFALFTVCLLLMDVCSFQRNGRNILAAVDTRGRQADNFP